MCADSGYGMMQIAMQGLIHPIDSRYIESENLLSVVTKIYYPFITLDLETES